MVVGLTSTGLEDLESLELFELFPNPTLNDIQLRVEFERSLDVRFEVLDLMGKLIWSQEARNSQFRLRVNMENQSAGTYLLRLQTEDGYLLRKFIKL